MIALRLPVSAPQGLAHLRRLRRELGDRPSLLPQHFLAATLERIGGSVYALHQEPVADPPLGYGFLLPRGSNAQGPIWTLRFEAAPDAGPVAPNQVIDAVRSRLPQDGQLVFYDPAAPLSFRPSHFLLDGVDIGRPSALEAEGTRRLQAEIWRSATDGLYPDDLHSDDAAVGSSLVARVDGRLAGFVLGFHRFGGPELPTVWRHLRQDLRLESQLLAVAPELRGRGIGRLLKWTQARRALAAGVDLISWTTDPLLFANAQLNFNRLGAVAWELHPNLYPFRNALNRAPASRLIMQWPVGLDWMRAALATDGPISRPTRTAGHMQHVNRGSETLDLTVQAPRIGIQIPADWVALQEADLEMAHRWRQTTDRAFAHYLGLRPDQYVLTGAERHGETCYLVGERVNDVFSTDLAAKRS